MRRHEPPQGPAGRRPDLRRARRRTERLRDLRDIPGCGPHDRRWRWRWRRRGCRCRWWCRTRPEPASGRRRSGRRCVAPRRRCSAGARRRSTTRRRTDLNMARNKRHHACHADEQPPTPSASWSRHRCSVASIAPFVEHHTSRGRPRGAANTRRLALITRPRAPPRLTSDDWRHSHFVTTEPQEHRPRHPTQIERSDPRPHATIAVTNP